MEENKLKDLDLELFQYEGKWKLPSLTPSCIAAQLYLKFINVPFIINNCNNSLISPSGDLPALRNKEELIGGIENIISYLSKNGFYLDYYLTNVQKGEIEAFISLIEEKLYYAILFNWWMEEKNLEEVTQFAFEFSMPFPLNKIIRYKIYKKYITLLKNVQFTNASQVYKMAEKVMISLSEFLEKKKYFFGDNPSSLDAIAFGHLACCLYPPMKENKLELLIKSYPNLVNYCNNIFNNFFGNIKVSTFFQTSNSTFYAPSSSSSLQNPSNIINNLTITNYFTRLSTKISSYFKKKTPEEQEIFNHSLIFMIGSSIIMGTYILTQNHLLNLNNLFYHFLRK